MIEKLMLPKLAGGLTRQIDLASAPAFPALHDVAKFLALGGLNERVQVIWHDDPGIELVVSFVARDQLFGKERGVTGIREHAFSMA